jgi:diguanylate cyclase (GGDEF)-like protein
LNSKPLPGTTLVVAAVDIDHFQQINTRYGHHAGDLILREAAIRMRRALGRDDLICRSDADHFLVATRVKSRTGALDTMDRLHQALTSNPVKSNVGRHEIGATIGVAAHGDGETEHELILRAGQALVTGKFSAKNRCYLAPQFDDLSTASDEAPAPRQEGAMTTPP